MVRARTRKPAKRERSSLLRLILAVAVLAWIIRSLIFAPFSIASGSMLPTLYVGDYLVVAKWPYGYSRFSFPFQFPPFEGRLLSRLPERGDIVVFRPAGGKDFVKRVIGLPGDTVEVRGGLLVLNGRTVPRDQTGAAAIPVSANSPCRRVAGASPATFQRGEERLCAYPAYRETLPNGVRYTVIDQLDSALGDTLPPTRVPPGRLFLMGDNRDDSFDSRFTVAEGGTGMVPVDHVVGRATLIFWSTDGSASYVRPWTWFSALRAARIGTTFGPDGR